VPAEVDPDGRAESSGCSSSPLIRRLPAAHGRRETGHGYRAIPKHALQLPILGDQRDTERRREGRGSGPPLPPRTASSIRALLVEVAMMSPRTLLEPLVELVG